MMKRDILENKIKQQLHDYNVDPPEGLWAAIESDLGKLEAAAENNTAARPTLRRKWSPGKGAMRYGIAATVLLALATFGIMYEDREPVGIADLVEQMPVGEESPSKPVESATLAATTQAAATEVVATETTITAATKTGNGKTLAKVTAQTPTNKAFANGRKTEIPAENSSEKTNIVSEAPNVLGDAASKPDATSKVDATPTPEAQRTPQARSKTAQWYDAIDKEPIKKRLNRRKSTSLYAANIGGGSSNVATTGISKMARYGFAIHEMSNDIGIINSLTPNEYHPESLRHHAPLTFGASVSWPLSKRFDIETGISYTYLKSDAEIKGDIFGYKVKQELHYLGIPVSVKYNIVDSRRWGVYARGGAMIEKGISGKITTKVGDTSSSDDTSLDMDGVQMSLSLGLGGEYKFTNRFSIYLEPGMDYYFKNSNQPANYRTENPLHFGLKAGIRVNFR